jgi:hypothetical protein
MQKPIEERSPVLNVVISESEISGVFPVIFRMELVSGKISGIFPIIPSKIPHFHVF